MLYEVITEDVGETFDSGLINEGENYRLDTSELSYNFV